MAALLTTITALMKPRWKSVWTPATCGPVALMGFAELPGLVLAPAAAGCLHPSAGFAPSAILRTYELRF